MILRNTSDTPMMKLLRGLLPIILSVSIGVGGGLITMRSEMSAITTSVSEMKYSNDRLLKEFQDIKNKQSAFLELYYIPKKEEWNDMVRNIQRVMSENEDDRRTLQRIIDDMHRYHVNDAYISRSRSNDRSSRY